MHPVFIIETPRLRLREMCEFDAEEAYLLNKDADVLRFTGDLPFESIDAAKSFLIHYEDYLKNGFGRWAVIEKESNAFLGWCGLKKHDDGMVDLGYRFHKKYWGNGFATEAAKACVVYGFEKLNLSTIVGRVAKDNHASIRVLEKLNMTFWKADACNGLADAHYYRISTKGWVS